MFIGNFQMADQNVSLSHLLEQFKTSYSDCNEIILLLPELINCFKREEDSEILLESISILLGPTVQLLPLKDLDQIILQPFLPLVKNFIFKTLSAIHEALEVNTTEELTIPLIPKNLMICSQVLTDVNTLLSYIVSLEQVSLTSVFNLPKHVAEIIHHVFIHCQKSQSEYKKMFIAVRNELKSLFQVCHKLQVNLYTLLNEKLIFNCNYENELQLLIDVVDILSSMADVVADLDTLSLVAHWKAYAQLTQTYAHHLCSRVDIAHTVSYLAANISHQLLSIKTHTDNEKKVILRSLKITSLQLKVLLKLCEHYKGYLGDCHLDLLNCLVTLVAHTNYYLEQQGVAEDIAAQVTTHLLAGAGPLTTLLISDPLFVKEYFKYADECNARQFATQVGYCHLTSLILKKLIQLCPNDNDIKDVWLIQTIPLVKIVFRLLHECTSREYLLVMYQEDIYQPLLVHLSAFLVTTCSATMFPQVERLLIGELLQTLLWPAMFSSDLLCIIARFGSSKLCYQITCLLSDILTSWPHYDQQRPERVYVSWTMSRLVKLLSSDHFHDFSSRLPSTETFASDITTLLSGPITDGTSLIFSSLFERLALLSDVLDLLPNVNHNVTDGIHELWQYMIVPEKITTTQNSHWFLVFFSVLVCATASCINSFNNQQIIQVLDILLRVTNHNTSLFLCSACEILWRLATKTIANDSSQSLVCQKISAVFYQLMQNKEPVVKCFSLETFSFFAYVTKHEQIVAETVAMDSRLRAEVTNYLEGMPIVESNTSFSAYIQALHQSFFHKCKHENNAITPIINKSIENPCKKIKISKYDQLISDALYGLEKNINFIEECSSSGSLKESHLSSLCNVVKRLDTVIKYHKV